MSLTKVSYSMIDGAVINAVDFGAVGDGVTDNTTALQAAIDATPVGGTLYIPAASNHYVFTTLTISESISIVGDGWNSIPNAVFGAADWNTASNNTGSILRSTATSGNAITVSSLASYISFNFRNFGLLGPGTGTSVGIKIGNPTVACVRDNITNILVANFYKGVSWVHTYEAHVQTMNIIACTYGLEIPYISGGGIFSDNHFFRCQFQNCYYGTIIGLASAVNFTGCLWQNNDQGFRLEGQGGTTSIECITVDGQSWFENVGGADLSLDTTNGGLKQVVFRDYRSSGASAINIGGGGAFNYLTFENVYSSGNALTIPSTAQNVIIKNCEFLSITDNSKRALIIDGNSFPRILGWIRFNGTAGTISASNNLTLTKNGTGDYTLSFVNQPYSGDFTVVASCQLFGVGQLLTDVYGWSTTSGNVRVLNTSGVLTDTGQVYVIVVGDF
jgi:hypothetical protein